MSLYNMMHGYHPHASTAIWLLGAESPSDFGRFRDAWFERDESGKPRIAVYTRNGGGNRDDYADVFDRLRQHPCYQNDFDDDFDSTYATIYFAIPEEYASAVNEGLSEDSTPIDMSEKWQKLINQTGDSA